jgi:hypothetical protein
MCLCVCVCVCVRACARARARVDLKFYSYIKVEMPCNYVPCHGGNIEFALCLRTSADISDCYTSANI